ncbi:MAG TPA: tRNA-binding protein [Longimicrobiales bacterium]|nr:tRNA-binding protein [Longimicrobiales bacterium]
MTIEWSDFARIDVRVGTILHAAPLEGARKPAYRLRIDFGEELREKQSSAQITDLYQPEDLIGRQIVGVVNFPPKRIANFLSEVLVLGIVGDARGVVLLNVDRQVPNGYRVG